MKKITNTLIETLKNDLRGLFYICLGEFLFILFFQPFPLQFIDFNARILYVAGFWGISFALSWLILIALPRLFPKWNGLQFALYFILLVLSSIAFAFYIFYVGQTALTLYILFKIFLVCLLPVIILEIYYRNKNLETQIDLLKKETTSIREQLTHYDEAKGENSIDILSGNKAERLSFKAKNIILIQSADNYIKLYYLENNELQNRLVRNTLKDVENQLITHKSIIRCHRTCLVNAQFIKKLGRNENGHTLRIEYIEEFIPVSRQYLTLIKESIKA